MTLSEAEQKLMILAQCLQKELNDRRLCDETGKPLVTVSDPLPAVAFVDAEKKRRALLEEAPDNRWLLQFFDTAGRLMATRSGRIQTI